MTQRRLEIVNIKGLHARASAKLVEVVEAFDVPLLRDFEGCVDEDFDEFPVGQHVADHLSLRPEWRDERCQDD